MAVDVDALVARIEAELAAAGTPERAEKERAYLRSELRHLGTSVPTTRAVVKAALPRRPGLDHDDLVAVVDALWSAPVHERRLAAVEALVLHGDVLGPADVPLLDRLLREARTWALVDVLADVAGDVLDRHPEAAGVLDRWAADPDHWMRRAALLALRLPLRRGAGDFDRFARYADAMLDERELFVRKAIGWVLRDVGRLRPDLVFEWLLPRAARAAGVTLREALKPLADDQRAAILAARGVVSG